MRLAYLLLSVIITGCSHQPAVREYLDSGTAATITIAVDGWVFARQRSDLAVNAQDYITVTPLQVNRSGERTIYLYCQLWSTIDRRGGPGMLAPNAELALVADDRQLALTTRSVTNQTVELRQLGISAAPVAPPTPATALRVIVIDKDFLRFVAQAHQVRIALTENGSTDYFVSWRDGRASFVEFEKRIGYTSQ